MNEFYMHQLDWLVLPQCWDLLLYFEKTCALSSIVNLLADIPGSWNENFHYKLSDIRAQIF